MPGKQADKFESPHVTVIGAGIAGLYAAYLLALADFSVEVFEQNEERCGGKIATRKYPEDDARFFAEFGPMRFELDLQDRFLRLCQHLGLGFSPFAPTGAPRIPSKYEMTDVERAFASVAHLHEWAVLRMFFGRDTWNSIDVRAELASIEENHSQDAESIGKHQLAWLQCYMDKRLFVTTHGDSVAPRPDADIEENFNTLRQKQHLLGDADFPLLRNLGLWQALSEVITPGAISKIRDSGTFYHFIAHNPSAVEWGIFWLRQASALGELFTFKNVDNGVSTLVDRLVHKLEQHDVPIRYGKEVLQIEPAKRPTEVGLRVVEHGEDGRAKNSFNLQTDHAILALPQWALQRLDEHFPDEVRCRLDGVMALPLLKAFVVTKNPWWQPHLKAQSYAWRVPTRELHFYRVEDPACPYPTDSCVCLAESAQSTTADTGMIMLYTDQPGIHYWAGLIPSDARRKVIWHCDTDEHAPLDAVTEVEERPFELLDFLVRRLLVLPHPGLPGTIEDCRPVFLEKLRDTDCRRRLEAMDTSLLDLSQQIVELLDGRKNVERTADYKAIDKALDDSLDQKPPNWLEALQRALDFRKNGIITRDTVRKEARHVVAYGIRDWSAEPFGGAAHVWRPGFSAADPDEEGHVWKDPLFAFPLRERGNSRACFANVHICGEAYSGHQGFIEGALRTAEQAVVSILREYDKTLPTLQPQNPHDLDKWSRERARALKGEWETRRGQ
jgi:monoamine oxidase